MLTTASLCDHFSFFLHHFCVTGHACHGVLMVSILESGVLVRECAMAAAFWLTCSRVDGYVRLLMGTFAADSKMQWLQVKIQGTSTVVQIWGRVPKFTFFPFGLRQAAADKLNHFFLYRNFFRPSQDLRFFFCLAEYIVDFSRE